MVSINYLSRTRVNFIGYGHVHHILYMDGVHVMHALSISSCIIKLLAPSSTFVKKKKKF